MTPELFMARTRRGCGRAENQPYGSYVLWQTPCPASDVATPLRHVVPAADEIQLSSSVPVPRVHAVPAISPDSLMRTASLAGCPIVPRSCMPLSSQRKACGD